MTPLRVLMVEDEVDWARRFQDNLRAFAPSDLVGPGYGNPEFTLVSNQRDAERTVSEAGPAGFQLVLLDLLYPENPGDVVSTVRPLYFRGVDWLPDLRRFLPAATIVVLTSYAHEQHLQNVVRAIRAHQADDFVPKTAPIEHVVERIGLAFQNARQRRRMAVLETELLSLTRGHAARTYAEDVAGLLQGMRLPLNRIAQQIETQDPSALAKAPDAIRGQVRFVMAEFDELTRMMEQRLGLGCRTKGPVDVATLARDCLLLYERWIEDASARPFGPTLEEHVVVTTFHDDLAVALHETVFNAILALKLSQTPSSERRLDITVQDSGKEVVICVRDNGDGFSDDAMEDVFQLGCTRWKEGGHQGLGLYIAKRMMHAVGGEISVRNRLEGGAGGGTCREGLGMSATVALVTVDSELADAIELEISNSGHVAVRHFTS